MSSKTLKIFTVCERLQAKIFLGAQFRFAFPLSGETPELVPVSLPTQWPLWGL